MDGSEATRRMVIGSVMRFRPIAPKPVLEGSVSGAASSIESKNSPVSKGRTKRKYVRVRRYNNTKKKTTAAAAAASTTTNMPETTLQLLPERHVEFDGGGGVSDPNTIKNRGAAVVELWVTDGAGCMDLDRECCYSTDEERTKKELDEDACPGFVSDGGNRVEWLNEAFKRMMVRRSTDSESPAGEEEIQAWLIISSRAKLGDLKKVFTCQIKVKFKNNNNNYRKFREITVPCDAWRLDGGGFAWKLDVKAALTLAPPLLQLQHF